MSYFSKLHIGLLVVILLSLHLTTPVFSQDSGESANSTRLRQLGSKLEQQERIGKDLKKQMQAIQEELASLEEDVSDLKDFAALHYIPVEDSGEESELQGLKAEVEELKNRIALMSDIPLVAPPLEEDLPPLLPEDLEIELMEEEFPEGTISHVPWITLFCIGLLFTLIFWGGRHWGNKRLHSEKWEYRKVENPDEEQIQALGREGWECVGIASEQREDREAKVHTFKRPGSLSSASPPRQIAPFFYLLIGLAIIASSMGNPTTFIDASSLLLVFVGTALFTLVHVPFKEIVEAVYCALGRTHVEPGVGEKARLIFAIMRSYALALGVLGFFIGLILILVNMDDPEVIGPGMAMGLLTVLYAIGLAQILVSALDLQVAMRMQNAGARKISPTSYQGLFIALLATFTGLAIFGGLFLSL